MRTKLFTPLLLNILAYHSVYAWTIAIHSTPNQWVFSDLTYGGNAYIPDASTSSHVTGIELGLTTTGAIYTFKIIGNGYTGTA